MISGRLSVAFGDAQAEHAAHAGVGMRDLRRAAQRVEKDAAAKRCVAASAGLLDLAFRAGVVTTEAGAADDRELGGEAVALLREARRAVERACGGNCA